MNKVALELKRLQEKATTVNGYIREVKSMIKDSRFRCEKYSPIDIDDIPMFYISKECWDWDEDCEPSGQQKYYAFLLYYRKVLKEIEKQIRIKKKLLKVHNNTKTKVTKTVENSIDMWHYPSKNDFPPFEKVVYIWDDGSLWRGHYHRYVKNNVEYKWWEVYDKGGIESMQDEVEAWAPLSAIQPPKEKEN